MADWKASVTLVDLFEAYLATDPDDDRGVDALKAGVGDRIRALVASKPMRLHKADLLDLMHFAAAIESVGDIDDFDAVMDDLYSWADAGHRLWIETF